MSGQYSDPVEVNPTPAWAAEVMKAQDKARALAAMELDRVNATKDPTDIYGDQCADTDGMAAVRAFINSQVSPRRLAISSDSPLMQQAQANATLASQASTSADNAFVPARPPVDQSGSVTYRAEDIMKIFDELANLKAQNAVLLAELTELKRTRPRQTIVDHFLAMPRSALKGGNGIPLSPL